MEDASPLTIVIIPIIRLMIANIITIIRPQALPENRAPAIPKFTAAKTPAKTTRIN